MTIDLKKTLLDARSVEKQAMLDAVTAIKRERLQPTVPGLEEDLGTLLRNEQARTQR